MSKPGEIELTERETLVHRIGYLRGRADELAALQNRLQAELNGALAELARVDAPQEGGANA